MHKWEQGGTTFPYTLPSILFLSPCAHFKASALGGSPILSRYTFAFQFALMTNTNENFTNIPD